MKLTRFRQNEFHSLAVTSVDAVNSRGRTDLPLFASALLDHIRQCVTRHGGSLKDFAGDGGVCLHAQVSRAVAAAEEVLLRSYEAMNKANIAPVELRVCIDFPILRWNADLAKITGPQLIWLVEFNKTLPEGVVAITEAAFQALDEGSRRRFSFYRSVPSYAGAMSIYTLDVISSSKVHDVATRRFDLGQSLDEIAAALRSRVTDVARLLDAARIKGIVQESVIVRAPRKARLEDRLRGRFPHLKHVSIVECDEVMIVTEIGKHAADYGRLEIRSGTKLAASCGAANLAHAYELRRRPGCARGVKIYPLIVTMTADLVEGSPTSVMSALLEAFRESQAWSAQFPSIETEPLLAKDRKNTYVEACKTLFDGARDATYLLTGIGAIGSEGSSHSFNRLAAQLDLVDTLRKLRAVGEMVYQPFTIDGEMLFEHPDLALLRSNVIVVDLEAVRAKVAAGNHVVAMAGGCQKHDAILGALRGKFFNVLFTDARVAEYVLKRA